MKRMTRNLFLMAIVLFAGVMASCCNGEKLKPKAKHVIMIGIDGWASKSFPQADMPTVKELMKNGSYTLQKRSVLPSASAILSLS